MLYSVSFTKVHNKWLESPFKYDIPVLGDPALSYKYKSYMNITKHFKQLYNIINS
jgi:hypothetical protein